MGASKTLRQANALLEPIGYRLEGLNQNNHWVYRHQETDAITRVGHAHFEKPRGAGNLSAQARRAVRHAESTSHRFVQWLLDKYDVGVDEQREVTLNVNDLGRRFLAEHPEIRGASPHLWRMAMTNTPLAEEVKRVGARGTGVAVWKLRGPLYGVRPVTENGDAPAAEPVVVEAPITQTEENVGSNPVPERGVERDPDPDPVVDESPVGIDDRRMGEGTEGTGAAPRAVAGRAVEAVPAGGGAASPVAGLPATLAEQLAEHFSGDLRAENAILRDALADATAALQGALQTLQAAESVIGTQRPAKDRVSIGTRNLRRLNLMRSLRGELPDQFAPDTIAVFLNTHGEEATHAAANSLLWTLEKLGVMRRAGRGVYEWAE